MSFKEGAESLIIIKYKRDPINMLERRVHYRRQNHYRTKSNKYKIVKTPGKSYHLLIALRW